jgi:hypothetical protein
MDLIALDRAFPPRNQSRSKCSDPAAGPEQIPHAGGLDAWARSGALIGETEDKN